MQHTGAPSDGAAPSRGPAQPPAAVTRHDGAGRDEAVTAAAGQTLQDAQAMDAHMQQQQQQQRQAMLQAAAQQGAHPGPSQQHQQHQQHQQQPRHQPYALAPPGGSDSQQQHMHPAQYTPYPMGYGPPNGLPPPPGYGPPPHGMPHYGAPMLPPPPPPGAPTDPFNLLAMASSHSYAQMGMGYMPYPPPQLPLPVPPPPHSGPSPVPIQNQTQTRPPSSQQQREYPRPPSRTYTPLTGSAGPPESASAPHAYSPLPPPPPRSGSRADESREQPASAAQPSTGDGELLPLAPFATGQRTGPPEAPVEEAGEGEGGDEDGNLRLPTPPSDIEASDTDDSDDGDLYEPDLHSDSRRRAGGRLRDAPPAKRARVSKPDSADEDNEDDDSRPSQQRRDSQKKKKARKGKKKEAAPPGMETTVDGSWRRKLSRGGWGGPGGTGAGSRPETFLRKLWKLMQDPETDVSAYMHWDQSGKLLIIPDEKSLVENVCKVHFAQQNITSFNKQMNNWDFKRHSRSQRDLAIIAQTEPNVTRNTRIWYHPVLDASSTLDDVQNVGRHEDGMAKKRRVKSKHTGVLEEGIGTGRGKRSKVTPPTRLSEFGGTSQSPAPSASPAVSAPPSASTSQRPTRSGGIGAGPSSARGAPSRRKRPRYTEHDASDDSSDSSSEEDDEDEEMGSSDEEKDAAEEAQSDADAEGEPDEELIAAANGDIKGKGKAVMPEPSPAVRGKSRAAPPPKRKVSPAEPASEKKQPRGVSASASPKKTGTPAPTTKRAAAAAAARAAQEAAASEKKEAARKAAEEAESRSPARGGSTTAAGRGRRSTAAADAAPAATANQQADVNEDVEVPSASKAANGRGGSRRPTKVVFNAVPDDVAEQPVPDPSEAPDSTSKEPTPRRGARGRQSAAKKADEAEPVNGAGTEKETAAPTRRSGRASNARATQVDVEEPASEDVPPDERDDVGPSRGTRGAARAARASLGAEVSAAAALGSAPELESRTDGEETAASLATRGARGGRGGARGGRGGRGGRARGGSARGRGTAAGSPRGRGRGSRANGAASEEMQRGGASFAPADVEAEDPNAAEDDAPPASLMLDSPPRSKEHRAAHVYSLPRPTHVGQGGPAGAGTSAAADAGLSRPHGSPSPASSRFLYPDASNPYGSSPYPAYPHQAQTPVTTHHHPTRPEAGVYHSEPGLARTAFYYFGVSPISRPYIHPGHAVPDDLLENGDEASVFGSDFATIAMGEARLPGGASGLAAYRLSSPVARTGFNPPALSAEGLRGPRQFSPPRLPGVATKRVASQVSAVRGQAAPETGLGGSASAAGPPPALQEEPRPEWSGLARRPSDLFPGLQPAAANGAVSPSTPMVE
ncbi:hypothetical protein JCM8202_003669 [Rhodotorula sphaerocarpa]